MMDAVAAHQADLFAIAERSSADDFGEELSRFVVDQERRQGIDRAARQRRRRSGRIGRDRHTGMTVVGAQFEPARGAKIDSRIRAEYRRLYRGDQEQGVTDRTTRQRWSDAIANVPLAPGGAAADDRLPVVIVEYERTRGRSSDRRGATPHCRVPGSGDIAAETAERFTCDCHHMVHEGGWSIDRGADWVDTWTGPTGDRIVRHPTGPPSRAAP